MTTAPPTQGLFAELRSLPRVYWVLVFGWFVNRFGTFVHPFLTLLLTSRGHPASSVAWVLSANGLGQFTSSMIGGYYSDRVGRRAVLVAGTFAHAIAVVSLYFVYEHSLGMIILLMFAAGFAGGLYMPASSALLADVVPEHLRLRAYSAQRLAINAGFACGTSAAGFIYKYSVFWLFAGDGLTTAAFGIIAWTLLPIGKRATAQEAKWSEAWRVLRGDRAFWALFVATILSAFVFMQFNSTFALEVRDRGVTLDFAGWHLTPEQVFGCILGWNGVMVVLFELPMTRWMQRFPAQRVIRLGYTLLGCGFAMNALPGGAGMLFFAMTIFTIGEMLSQPMRSAYVAQLAPPHMRGRYMGALAMGATLASVLGPFFSIPLHDKYPTVLWVGCGVLGLLAAVALGRGKRSEM